MNQGFNFRESYHSFLRNRSALQRLILINVVVFILLNLFTLVFWLFRQPYQYRDTELNLLAYWLSVPADLHTLLLRPWSVFTYMFVQVGLLHLLFNMIVLYFGGKLFLWMLNERKLVSTYILGGLCGALFYVVSYNLFPVFREDISGSVAIGASASVLSVLVAAATHSPNFELNLLFIGRVKLKYVALVLVIMDLLSITQGNPGGHLAHLGGASWGFIYIRFFLNRGWKGFSFPMPNTSFRRKKPFRGSYVNTKPVSDEDYNEMKNRKQEEIDRILEKISKYGYEGLSSKEKEILFKAGKK